MNAEMEGRIQLIFGPSFTGKTTYALGEESDDLVDYHEWEPGGFRRAGGSIPSPKRVTVHKYRTPLTNIESLGTIQVSSTGGTAPQAAYKLEGWREVYTAFLTNYIAGLKGEGRPVVDTATRLWLAVRQAFNEQLQDATGNEMARLDQIKYTEPNARMTQIAEAAERFGKDLILIAHEDTVFGTSQVKPDTFKELVNLADITLRFQVRSGKPVATVFKMGEGGMGMMGREIPEPTIGKVNALLGAAAKLRGMKMEFPEDNEEMMELAAAL